MVGKHTRMFVGIICAVAISLAGVGGTTFAQIDQASPDAPPAETRHFTSDAFLDFWQRSGAEATLGNPITPELDENGRTVQYFDFARLELWPDDPNGEAVRLGDVGAELLQLQLADATPQPRRAVRSPWGNAGIAVPAPNPPLVQAAHRLNRANVGADTVDRRFITPTRHTVQFGFKAFWEATGEADYLGNPLTEEYTLDGVTYQFFERGKLSWTPDQEVRMVQVGRKLAERYEYDLTPATDPAPSGGVIAEADPEQDAADLTSISATQPRPTACDLAAPSEAPPAQVVEELRVTVTMLNLRTGPGTDCPMIGRLNGGTVVSLHGRTVTRDDYAWSWMSTPLGSGFAITSAVGPIPDLLSFTSNPNAERWIEVDLTNQYLIAWEGGVPVIESRVSTGRGGFETPPGTYQIILKLDSEHMEGTNRGEYFNLPDVPWVMYFTGVGHAIHGTYWHNNFGTPMSHGCVNLPIPVAEQLYHWAPMGTRVEVRY